MIEAVGAPPHWAHNGFEVFDIQKRGSVSRSRTLLPIVATQQTLQHLNKAVKFLFLDSLTNRSTGLVPDVSFVMFHYKINKHMGKEIAAAYNHSITYGCSKHFQQECQTFYPKIQALAFSLTRFLKVKNKPGSIWTVNV